MGATGRHGGKGKGEGNKREKRGKQGSKEERKGPKKKREGKSQLKRRREGGDPREAVSLPDSQGRASRLSSVPVDV